MKPAVTSLPACLLAGVFLAVGPLPASSYEVAKLLPPPITRGEDPWVAMPAPRRGGPFGLALRHAETGVLRASGVVAAGEPYGLALLPAGGPDTDVGAWCFYVVLIDAAGAGMVLFPRAGEAPAATRAAAASALALGPSPLFTVGPPFGRDTYYLLTTLAPIPEPARSLAGGLRRDGARLLCRMALASHLGRLPRGAWFLDAFAWESVASR